MKFSIRDLLLVTVIVALAVGWWVNRQQLVTELVATKKQLEDSPWQAHRWEETAKVFAKTMREEGWFVRVQADGGYSITHRKSLGPGRADELNKANPLP